ncbi:hypothetical protein P3X46_025114 [Hevea brasiliensis]|uniref:Reverse transcriptase zinc-binding domain-containing protein n=1 Tax=Hevea brasiliensis TaxID=3981 RepID=A0ABQ9L7X3_HEVBR|nr:hypothetical protein P3X46_025114 [Hevea brasiliensis]
MGCHDSIVWHFDRSGVYSVKSGYRFLVNKARNANAQHPHQSFSISKDVWKSIWSLDMQPKIKVFMWKVMLNALPSKENLYRRGITLDFNCPICQREVKSIEHILFWCDHSKVAWFAGPCSYKPNPMGFRSVVQWWESVVHHFSNDQKILAAIAFSC